MLSLLKLVQSPDIKAESIEMKFLVIGHSYLPNDAKFAIIETHAKKTQMIYDPSDWYDIIKSCKKTDPFEVIEMTHNDFLSTKILETAVTNRKQSTDGSQVNWLKMQCIKVERAKPFSIQYKYDLNDEEYKTIDLRIHTVGKPTLLKNVDQPLLYPNGRTISKEKLKDMKDLLKYIPPIKHEYFTLLTTDSNSSESPPETEEDVVYMD